MKNRSTLPFLFHPNLWFLLTQLYENGVAGIHITGSTNFTFDATIGPESTSGEGNVGSIDGQQPIEVVVEGSTLVTFNDLRVQSSNSECWFGFRVCRYHTHLHSFFV